MSSKRRQLLFSTVVAVALAAFPSRSNAENLTTTAVAFDDLTLTIPGQLIIEKVAAEPLVRWPIVADWDRYGRLVVAESGGVAKPIEEHNKQQLHRLIRLVDTDGDGHFDTRIVAAESLAFPEGVLCIEDSILVSTPPQIWKFDDRDGDGVCEDREIWFDGQTITGCANDLHGPYLGRDGWIYWCKGAFAHQSHGLLNGKQFESSAAHIYRRRLSGGPIEVVMTGGMDNPVEVAFTPEGERFFTSTFLQHPGDGRRDGIAHAIYGGVYGKEHAVIDGHPKTGALMPIMTHLGPAAPSGLICLKSTNLLESIGLHHANTSWLVAALFNLQTVSLHQLQAIGSTFQTVDHVLVKGSRIDFHPTDIIEDADGSLLVIDTGGWYDLCCPSSKLDQQTASGGIYRISSSITDSVVDPRGDNIAWDALSVDQAIEFLSDQRPLVRQLAQQRCVRSKDHATKLLRSCILDEALPKHQRIEAIWAACQISSSSSNEAIVAALRSSEPSVRQAASHAVSVQRIALARPIIEQLVESDPNASVRRVSAEALGRIGNMDSLTPLLKAMNVAGMDRVLEHSLLYAMIEIDEPDLLIRSLASENPREVFASLVVLDQLRALDQSHLKQLFTLLDSDNVDFRETAMSILKRNPSWAESSTLYLDERYSRIGDKSEKHLAEIADAWQYEAAFQNWLGKYVESWDSQSPSQRTRLLEVVTQFRADSVPKQWDSAITSWLRSADEPTLKTLTQWIKRWSETRLKGSGIGSTMLTLANDPQRSIAARLECLAALPSGLSPSAENSSLIVEQYLNSSSEHHQLATEAMLQVVMDAQSVESLIASAERIDASKLMAAVTAVSRVNDDQLDRRMLAKLSGLPAAKTLSIDSLRNLYRKRSNDLRRNVDQAIESLQQPTQVIAEQLEVMMAKLPDGDPTRGFAVFRSERAACHACHRIAYVGGNVGPELSHIGSTRSRRQLLEAIMFPSARLEQSYQPLRVLTGDGTVYNGMVRSETSRVLELAIDATRVISIDKDQIELREPSLISVMPAGLLELLSLKDIADLLAFLESVK